MVILKKKRPQQPSHSNFLKKENYSQVLKRIIKSKRFGIELGLERTRETLRALGSPDKAYSICQIGGTNGKGSTSMMLGEILKKEGHTVGVFTSPHLERFTERFRVNGLEVLETDVVEAVEEIESHVKEPLTFFEWSTSIALVVFKKKGCNKVILEVGLGGRLDATTAAKRELVVVTGIDFDHQEYLGHTLQEIANEKAAIVVRGEPALIGMTGRSEGRGLLKDAMSGLGALPLRCLDECDIEKTPGHWSSMTRQNAACAIRAAAMFGCQIDHDTAIESIETLKLPGRMETIKTRNNTFILDGAHNGGAARKLAQDVGAVDVIVLGINNDKDVEKIIAGLSLLTQAWIVTKSKSDRAIEPVELATAIKKQDQKVSVVQAPSIENALAQVRPGDTALICGSLYLVGEASALIQKS